MEENKTFTQEEVNNIVSKRLAEERAKFNQQLQQKEAEYNTSLKEYKASVQREKVHSRLLDALNKHNVIEPGEMVKLVKDRVHTDDTGESYYLTDTGEHLTIEEGVTHWANKNLWAVKNNQKPGAGSGQGAMSYSNADPIAKAFKLSK